MGSGTGVAAHPVAQLTQQVTPADHSQQALHRPLHSRTHTFHTIYDGEGRRIKKVVTNGETTVFVYDASGKLVAEYSTVVAPSAEAKAGYLTADHLGSPRIITDQNGAVVSRHDYTGFGRDIAESLGNIGGRSTGYGVDDKVRKQFTGYERDDESGLEYAQARYYNAAHGRFTSVDPLTASASIRNPQTFNRYSYVLNSPYKFVDPLGLISESTGACGNRCRNSGPTVDGSAFRGRDASFDWTEQSSPPPPPPPPTDFSHLLEKSSQWDDSDFSSGYPVYGSDKNAPGSSRLEPTCPKGCSPALNPFSPVQYEPENGDLIYTVLPVRTQFPAGVPVSEEFETSRNLERAIYGANFTLTVIDPRTGQVRTDYDYAISYGLTPLDPVSGVQPAPSTGVIDLGTYVVDSRTFNPSEGGTGYALLREVNGFTRTGTVTIYNSNGTTMQTSFEGTVNGNNGNYVVNIRETSRRP